MTLKEKCQSYARSYYFSFSPEEWSYDELNHFLRIEEDGFAEMAERFNMQDELVAWEPFEDYNPSWVADQMDMMASQLEELFK